MHRPRRQHARCLRGPLATQLVRHSSALLMCRQYTKPLVPALPPSSPPPQPRPFTSCSPPPTGSNTLNSKCGLAPQSTRQTSNSQSGSEGDCEISVLCRVCAYVYTCVYACAIPTVGLHLERQRQKTAKEGVRVGVGMSVRARMAVKLTCETTSAPRSEAWKDFQHWLLSGVSDENAWAFENNCCKVRASMYVHTYACLHVRVYVSTHLTA